MNGWMDGWMDRWMDGWMDGWIDGWIDGWTHGQRAQTIYERPRERENSIQMMTGIIRPKVNEKLDHK